MLYEGFQKAKEEKGREGKGREGMGGEREMGKGRYFKDGTEVVVVVAGYRSLTSSGGVYLIGKKYMCV